MEQPVTDYPLRVLLVEDEVSLRDPLAKYLRNEHGYEVDPAADLQEARSLLAQVERPYDVALIDDLLAPAPKEEPEYVGIALLREIKGRWPETECIIFTGWGMDRALEALQAGAYRYLAKPLNLDELGMTIRMAAEQARLRRVSKARDTAKVVAEVSVLGDLQSTLGLIVKGTQGVLLCDAVTLYTYDQARDEFGFPPAMVGVRDTAGVLKLGSAGRDSAVRRILALAEAYVAEDARSDPVAGSSFVQREDIKSSVGIPLNVGDRKVGVMFVNYRSHHRFTDEELTNIELFANQAAVAIRNAQLYEETTRRANALEALYEASQAVTGTLTHNAILDHIVHIVEQAWRLAEPRGEKTHFSHLALVDGNHIKFVAAHPPGALTTIREKIDLESDVPIGIMGRVVLTGHSQLVGNVLENRDYIEIDPYVHSQLSVPMQMGEQVIGVISVEHPDYNAFDEEDRQALESLAAQAAIAIENARLYEREQRRACEAEAMVQVGQAINSTLDLDEILETVAKNAPPLLGLDDGMSTIFLVDEKTGDFVRSTRVPPRKDGEGPRQSGGLTSLVIETGEPIIIPDVRRDSRVRASVVEGGVRSFIGVPLKVKERTIGVLFASAFCHCDFTQHDVEMLSSLANQAAVAIENARLFRETKHRALRLAAASEVARDATAILDVKWLLDETVRLISERFGFYHAGVFLLDDKGEYAVLHAASSEGGRRMLEREHRLKVGEVGIVGFVTGTGELRIALDVRKDAVHFSNPDLPDTRSEMALPFTVRGQVIGALDVQSTEVSAFTNEDVATLQIMADHLANAIESARLYEKLQQEAKQLALINQIAVEISSTLDLKKILQTLVNELARIIGVEQCAIAIFDEKGEYGDIVAEYLEEGCVPSTGIRIPLRENLIVEMVRKTKLPVVVRDAQHDPRMEKVWEMMKQHRIQSIMVVPIVVRDNVIGTIDLDAVSVPRDFTVEEQWLAETIAHHAAIAIQNAGRYEELKRTKGLVGARTALAWMGMTSSAWRHAIGNYATTIQDLVELARRDIAAGATADEIRKRLSRVEDMVDKIRSTPITAPLQAEEGVGSVAINALLRERIKQLWRREPYKDVQVSFGLGVGESTTVRASPDWLRRAFDILVDNAVEAMADSPTRQLTIVTHLANGGVELIIADTGKGIPNEVLQRLFQVPIPRPKGSKGLGVGLLMAHTIVQTYGGDIRLDSTGPSGTKMIVWLPVES